MPPGPPAAFTDHLARRSAGWRGPIRRSPPLYAETKCRVRSLKCLTQNECERYQGLRNTLGRCLRIVETSRQPEVTGLWRAMRPATLLARSAQPIEMTLLHYQSGSKRRI